ncbi:MAG: hypothetical protein FD138_2753 [Planctomycetota bacterium]|nr:MAG: hypothetical protein FD138_2753 [Planctomycetota bacterium]
MSRDAAGTSLDAQAGLVPASAVQIGEIIGGEAGRESRVVELPADEVVRDFGHLETFQLLKADSAGSLHELADAIQDVVPFLGVLSEGLNRQQVVHPMPIHVRATKRLVHERIVEIPSRENVRDIELRTRTKQRLHTDGVAGKRALPAALFRQQNLFNVRTSRLSDSDLTENALLGPFSRLPLHVVRLGNFLPILSRALQIASQLHANDIRLAELPHDSIHNFSDFRQSTTNGGVPKLRHRLEHRRQKIVNCRRLRRAVASGFARFHVRLPGLRVFARRLPQLLNELRQCSFRVPRVPRFQLRVRQFLGRVRRELPSPHRSPCQRFRVLKVQHVVNDLLPLSFAELIPRRAKDEAQPIRRAITNEFIFALLVQFHREFRAFAESFASLCKTQRLLILQSFDQGIPLVRLQKPLVTVGFTKLEMIDLLPDTKLLRDRQCLSTSPPLRLQLAFADEPLLRLQFSLMKDRADGCGAPADQASRRIGRA